MAARLLPYQSAGGHGGPPLQHFRVCLWIDAFTYSTAFALIRQRDYSFRENREVPLTPKVFDTLLVLLENSSHVLTKKELMEQVWPDSFVEENNLAQNISILRKALGEGKEGEQYIQTVPKRGYRFVADVRTTGGDDESVIVRERTRARIVVERDDEDDLSFPARA